MVVYTSAGRLKGNLGKSALEFCLVIESARLFKQYSALSLLVPSAQDVIRYIPTSPIKTVFLFLHFLMKFSLRSVN